MPISYCDLHKRLFDQQRQTWVTWPRMDLAMAEPFCDVLDSARGDSASHTVIPMPCDLCTAIARQAVDERMEPLQ